MTTQEFSSEFDILYNNIMSNVAPGLNFYEKSVFLTQAQESLVLQLYEGSPASDVGFENSEKMMQSLKELVTTVTLPVNNKEVILPDNLLFILRESANLPEDKITCSSITSMEVLPTTLDNLNKMLKNPFRGPKAGIVLRLVEGNKLKLHTDTFLKDYTITYLRRPRPIILEDLGTDILELDNGDVKEVQLTIEGLSTKTECELNDLLHRQIVQIAVQLAKISWKS